MCCSYGANFNPKFFIQSYTYYGGVCAEKNGSFGAGVNVSTVGGINQSGLMPCPSILIFQTP